MTLQPSPTRVMSDVSLYERLESQVRSYSRAMPRQFSRATDVWMHDDRGGRYLDFLSGCSTLNYGHNHPVLKQALLDYISADGIAHGLDLHTEAKAEFLSTLDSLILKPRGLSYRAMFTGPAQAGAVREKSSVSDSLSMVRSRPMQSGVSAMPSLSRKSSAE